MRFTGKKLSGLIGMTVFDTRDKYRLVNAASNLMRFSTTDAARFWFGITVLRALLWDLIFRFVVCVSEDERYELISSVSRCLSNTSNSNELPVDHFYVIEEERTHVPQVLREVWPEVYVDSGAPQTLPYQHAIFALFTVRLARAHRDFESCDRLFTDDAFRKMGFTLLEQVREPTMETFEAILMIERLEDRADFASCLVRGHYEAAMKLWRGLIE